MTIELQSQDFGRRTCGDEPLVFHCNHYNYWLQKTLLLNEELPMESVIHDAAAAMARQTLLALGLDDLERPEDKTALASKLFGTLGFGTMRFAEHSADKAVVRVPVSHYGQCLAAAAGATFARPQSYFDAGYAAGTLEALYGLEAGAMTGHIEACTSMGADEGLIMVQRSTGPRGFDAPGLGPHGKHAPTSIYEGTNIDEPAILTALAGLDLSGNEEGLIPRFGVMLTNHFANFYNRISFEFVRRMSGTGMLEMGEILLQDAGYQCAFNTFGGIMISDEWKAVVQPQCKTADDWIAGMVAVVNALGWGTWRIHELSEERIVMRIYDDYESTGYLAMYGEADRPVCHLAQAGVVGIMNLVRVGDIMSGPTLDRAYFSKVFESDACFMGRQTACLAQGDDYTEVVAERP